MIFISINYFILHILMQLKNAFTYSLSKINILVLNTNFNGTHLLYMKQGKIYIHVCVLCVLFVCLHMLYFHE